MDFTKMTVAEIRDQLKEFGYSEEDANNIKGKAALVDALTEEMENGDNVSLSVDDEGNMEFGNLEELSDIVMESEEGEKVVPTRTSPEWSDYVLSQLSDDETLDGNPTVAGLRRLVTLFFGEIIVSDCHVVEGPHESNQFRAVARCTVEVFDDAINAVRKYSDAADVYPGNTDETYARYAVATACTRAEARALRKLLGLRAVSAEEVTSQPAGDSGYGDQIVESQIKSIDILCNRNNIDVWEFINGGKDSYEHINQISYGAAQRMIQHLNTVQNDPSAIKEEWKGYKDNWRK